MSEELKPRPFCGSRIVKAHYDRDHYFRVDCFECDASGPAENTTKEAKVAWNTRGALATGAVTVGVGDWEGAPGVEPLDRKAEIGYTDSARLE